MNLNKKVKEIIAENKITQSIPNGKFEIYYIMCPPYLSQIEVDNMMKILTPEEKERYHRFKPIKKKKKFLLGRFLLKLLVHTYTNIPIEEIYFLKNKYGKPFIPYNKYHHIKFNLSFSDCIVTCAFTCNRNIGIDIEKIKFGLDILNIANRYFSKRENNYIHESENKYRAFFNIWTLREAYVKAEGKGLFIPLVNFEIPIYDFTQGINHFSLFNFQIEKEYSLSVAIENDLNLEYSYRIKKLAGIVY